MTTPACRFCNAPLTRTFLDLGRQPVSNDFLSEAQLRSGNEPFYPLHVRVCDQCFLVQADDPVAADAMFTADYAYFSSYSEAWLKHCQAFAAMAVNRFDLGPDSQVVEVASNDGYLLQYFKAEGVPVLGIEPTANTAAAAVAKGIPTEVRFFNKATGQDLQTRGVAADLMFGANVLAHVPDIGGFVAGFPHVLKAEGTLVFEFPHLLRMIEAVQFDTIYHEHFSYLSLLAVEHVLAANNLRAYDVEELWTHGGSLRLYCCHMDAPFETTDALCKVRDDEANARLDQLEGYEGFTAKSEAVRDSFLAFLRGAKAEGKTVAAYGAAAKGNTFLNYAHVGTDDIACVYDRNPHKQGRFLPGAHLPILPPERITELKPDYVVILPWNLRDEIMTQLAFIKDWGGRFVTASPKTEIVGVKFTASEIGGVFRVDIEPATDARGSFARLHCPGEFSAAGIDFAPAQTSLSRNTAAGTLRGMHYQAAPMAETKLVRVTRGSAFDVVVDLRPGSPTYRRWAGFELSADNGAAVLIPEGLAHGFITLEPDTDVLYQIAPAYAPGHDRGVRWNDPAFGIKWPRPPAVISDRDAGYADFPG